MLHSVDDAGVVRVLLQHRAAWSHHGDTWGLPGGAIDSHEDPEAAAIREAGEEAGIERSRVRTRHTVVDDHGGWAYTTVLADAAVPLPTVRNRESHALEWVALDEVPGRPLHPGFAASWPHVRVRPVVLVVDAANVVGSRPDGWWRDRAGAAERLLGGLAGLRAVTAWSPSGQAWLIGGVVAVLEGAAQRAAGSDWGEVLRASDAGGTGDDVVVHTALRRSSAGQDVVVVTADRGLRARLGPDAGSRSGPVASAPRGGPEGAQPRGGPEVAGPQWLWSVLGGTAPPRR